MYGEVCRRPNSQPRVGGYTHAAVSNSVLETHLFVVSKELSTSSSRPKPSDEVGVTAVRGRRNPDDVPSRLSVCVHTVCSAQLGIFSVLPCHSQLAVGLRHVCSHRVVDFSDELIY